MSNLTKCRRIQEKDIYKDLQQNKPISMLFFFKDVFQFRGAALLRDTDQWWLRILHIATVVLSVRLQDNRSSK